MVFSIYTQIEYYDKDVIKNILGVLTVKPEKVVFIYDKEIKDMNPFEGLKKCFTIYMPNVVVETYPVDILNVDEIYKKTLDIINSNSNTVIELTGGSELMTIAGFKAGQEKNTELLYTDIATGKIIDISGNSNIRETVQLTLKDFIDARGAMIIGKSKEEPKEDMYTDIINMSRVIFSNLSGWSNTCTYFQSELTNTLAETMEFSSRMAVYNSNNKKMSPDKEILSAFQKYGFIHDLRVYNEKRIKFTFSNKDFKKYITNYGIWLEFFVFITLKRTDFFDDVLLGAMIDWNAYDGLVVAGNEIDVIAMDNSMPVFISCKLKSADTASLNELLITKKRIGGWFSKGVMVTFSNDKRNNTGTYKRAKELGIEMLDKNDILSKNFGERLIKTIHENNLVKLKWKKL